MTIPYYSLDSVPIPWDHCTGQGLKRTLVMMVQSEYDTHLSLLKKILSAVNLNFETDISFLCLPEGVRYSVLSDPQLHKYDNLMTFGFDLTQLGLENLNTPPCVFHFENITCIIAPSLSSISDKPAMKKALWNILKGTFEHSAP